MLKKLVKYDFIWIGRVLAWYMLAALLCGGFLRAMDYAYNNGSGSMFWLVMDKIALSLLISACISLFINAFIRTVVRFVRTLYKDESYFTHTLPTDRFTLYNAKALSGAAAMALALAAVGAALLLAGGKSVLEILKQAAAGQAATAVLLLALILLEALCMLFSVYFGMVLGYAGEKAKGPLSVLYGIAIYFLAQGVILLIVGLMAALDGSLAVFFKTNAAEIDPTALAAPVKKLCAATTAGYAVLDALLFLIGRRVFAKGVNVD